MALLRGKNMTLYVEHDGLMEAVACSTSLTITIAQEALEATKPGASRWRSLYAGRLSYNLSNDGLFVTDENITSARKLYDKLISGDSILWVAMDIENTDVYFSGSILPTSLSITSPATGAHTFSFTAEGTGGLNIENPYSATVLTSDGDVITDVDGDVFVDMKTGGMPPFR